MSKTVSCVPDAPGVPSTADDEKTPCRDPYLSSGPSPTRLNVHLIGVGKVGRALLGEIGARGFRVRCASDRSASVFSADGLDAELLAAHKAGGHPLSELPGAQEVHTATAASISGADAVVDCTDTDPREPEQATERCLAVLRGGADLVLAQKSFLATAPLEWFSSDAVRRTHYNAVLGGTGRALASELPRLRRDVTEIVAVPNASTTALIEAVERGAQQDEALQLAQCAGCLEADPTLDLDGTDAALKLLVAGKLVFGLAPTLAEIERHSFAQLDLELVRWRARRGLTTRLVARARADAEWRVCYEAVERGHSLAVSSRSVIYGYRLASRGLRLHGGDGIGPVGTARAIAEDLAAVAQRRAS